jgi:hypothetical protein
MKTLIREFLHFSRTEQKGIIVLASLTFLVIGIRIWIRLNSEVTFHIPPNELIALQEMIKQMDQEDSVRAHEQNYPYEKKSELIQKLKKDLDMREAELKERFNKEIKDKIFIIKKNFKVEYTNQ